MTAHIKGNGREQVRIGFYVCHCGHNIGAMVDCAEVARFASDLPRVALSRDYKYMCSDPGQELIQKDIREHGLNRIVVASCSPLLHEHTFRSAVEAGGLNPFYFHMVNIREHNSWVHTDRAEATTKAKELTRAAVARVAGHKALEVKRAAIHPAVLVVGAGIAGIHAAMTLANAGKKVILVEREPTIGGHMAKFDKTFPTLDCAACILTPKMSAAGAHPNITLMTCSEVAQVDGFVGNFTVKIKTQPRFVLEDKCIGLPGLHPGLRVQGAQVPRRFQRRPRRRRPIYIPFPQATPQVVLIDPKVCLNFDRKTGLPKETGGCKKTCVTACGDKNAIDFTQRETTTEVQVGTIIVATGFQAFDPRRTPQYGYGRYQNVYSALEIERLVNASGPTSGEVVCRDGKKPGSIALIHCVGSRDYKTNKWCSRVCCMYSMKLAHLLKEHTDAEVYSFYIDMRTPGKGYEEFLQQAPRRGRSFHPRPRGRSH